MRRYLALLLLALLVACAPMSPSLERKPPPAQAEPVDHPVLGSPPWYAWVDARVHVTDALGHGPDLGSDEWNHAVQHRLGQQAPLLPVGSPAWQQAVDTLLRLRTAPQP